MVRTAWARCIARDTRFDRTVAIKVLNSLQPRITGAFCARSQDHLTAQPPRHLHADDLGSENGTDFLVMEYLEGKNLEDRFRKGPQPPAVAANG